VARIGDPRDACGDRPFIAPGASVGALPKLRTRFGHIVR
jgi:hypothetical protein